jgi:hypothetical protein
MIKHVALHDRRMIGGVPARPDLGIVNLDDKTPLAKAFGAINAWARPHPLDTVFVLCHGKAGLNDEERKVCRLAGGSGLTLGKEKVLHTNVHLWSAIRGRVQNIVVYSCRAAMTAPEDRGTMHDGQYLMRALALHTQAFVFASDDIQHSHRIALFVHGKLRVPANGRMIIAPWEGNLYRFPPTGGAPKIVAEASKEFATLMRDR